MNIVVTSNQDGTDYALHNLLFSASVHSPNEPSEFFVLRAADPLTRVQTRVFLERRELELLRDQIARVLEQAKQAETQNTQERAA